MPQSIDEIFAESIAVKKLAQQQLAPAISLAAEKFAAALAAGGKILSCGNGGSAADCQHFSAELVNRFETERQALAAIALTTDSSALTSIANDYDYLRIFSRQVEALGASGDCLLAISTSGNSENVLKAIKVAQDKDMQIVVLSGGDGGKIAPALQTTDVEIRVPSNSTARIQEVHLLVIHALCAYLDQHFSN